MTYIPWPVFAILAAWLANMLVFPIMAGKWGDKARTVSITIGVVLQTIAVVEILAAVWGYPKALASVFAIIVMSWAIETIGAQTGLPFGAYHYTARLQPQLGKVPLIIPLAWAMMLPPAWAIADGITRGARGIGFAALSATAFTAWDLFLDPQMVAWDFWRWERKGGYFGIPWSNYAGWWVFAIIFTLLIQPGPLPAPLLIVIYGLTWLLEWIGQAFFWGLRGSALAGGLVMGACLAAGLLVELGLK